MKNPLEGGHRGPAGAGPMGCAGGARVWLLAVAGLVAGLYADEAPDLTAAVEYVADPSYARYKGVVPKASTLYDLQVYHDRIFAGNGNWGSNNGPLHMVAVVPSTKVEIDECVIGTESAEVLRVLSDGNLYVPATDQCERDESHGLFFRRNAAGEWHTHTRQIVDKSVCMHFWDIADYGNRLFLAGFGIASSADGGATWSRVDVIDPDPDNTPYWPFRGFIKCGGELFCRNEIYLPFDVSTGELRKDPYSGDSSYYWRWNPDTLKFDTLWNGDFREVYEGVTLRDFKLCWGEDFTSAETIKVAVWHPTAFKDRSVYILCDAYAGGMVPVAAISAWVENWRLRGRRIQLEEGAFPCDITVFGDAVYMLSVKYRPGTRDVEHAVWKSTDGENFAKILTFGFQQVLTSLEYHDGYFYFGAAYLGYLPYLGELAAKNDLAGRIYRVPCPQEPIQVVASVATNEVVEGSSVRIGYRLSAAPEADVTLSVVRADGNPKFTTSRSTLTFTPADWNVEQEVVVTLGDIETGDFSPAAITCGVQTPDSVRGAFASTEVTAASVALTPIEYVDAVERETNDWFRVEFADEGYEAGVDWMRTSTDRSGGAWSGGAEGRSTLDDTSWMMTIVDGYENGLVYTPSAPSTVGADVVLEGVMQASSAPQSACPSDAPFVLTFKPDYSGAMTPVICVNGVWQSFTSANFVENLKVSWKVEFDQTSVFAPRLRVFLSEPLTGTSVASGWIAGALPARKVNSVSYIGRGTFGDFKAHYLTVKGGGETIELAAPVFATDGSALGFEPGEGGATRTFRLTVANPVKGAYYTVLTATDLKGPFLPAADSTLFEAGGSLTLRVDADVPQLFAKILVSLTPHKKGEVVE